MDGAGPGDKGPGVVLIYPGICDKKHWPACNTSGQMSPQNGVLLAQAVPADYAGDVLLTNWTKPSYNPIIASSERDPANPWRDAATGEWRTITFDGKVYSSASDATVRAGEWQLIGPSKYFNPGLQGSGPTLSGGLECPSVYPLPGPTPGFEKEYDAGKATFPTHVHKKGDGCSGPGQAGSKGGPESTGCDFWQLGTYSVAATRQLGTFLPTKDWEDLFEYRLIENSLSFYASKDGEFPTRGGGTRRVNWGAGETIAPKKSCALVCGHATVTTEASISLRRSSYDSNHQQPLR